MNDYEEEDLCWFCDIFSLKEDSRGEYQGFGFYVDLLSCRKLEYDADRYELIQMRPGDYLYGVYSSTIDFRDPAVLEPFFDYAKEHHLKLGDTACLSLQFINRKENVRTYYYDVTIPIIK